jgi:TRAP-type C4-dicarboxylate transport system substrate-binding protein
MRPVFAKLSLLAGLVVVVCSAAWGVTRHRAGTLATVNPRTIRWYVVHARDYREYDEQLRAFAQRLSERTGGALRVEFTSSDIGIGWRDRAAERNGYNRVVAGDFDMCQLGTDTLGADVIELPFVFRNYDHAEAVWRGPIGEQMLADISTRTGGRLSALAFSYSGGFRVLVGRRPIRSADDVRGAVLNVDTAHMQPDEALLLELGANAGTPSPVNDFPDDRSRAAGTVRQMSQMLSAGQVDLFSVEINGLAYVETKYGPLDVRPLYVNVTEQSMYATAMVANTRFLASLPPNLRRVLEDETRAFALAERRLSAELAERNLAMFTQRFGHTVVPFPRASRSRFVAAGRAVQRRSPQWASVLREIEAAGEVPLRLASAGAPPQP